MDPVTVFRVGDRRFGLPLGNVERVLRAVAVTPLPKAPGVVAGIIDIHGEIVPVVDIRIRFGLPERGIAPGDQLLVARTAVRKLAVIVNDVSGVIDCSETDRVAADAVVPGAEYLQSIVRLADGMVLIQDLDAFLSLDEERTLEQALTDNP